jgi:ribosomal protein L16 Arg81 hydroxylase
MVDWYQRGFGWLLIGPAGTQTAPHYDLFSTHAWTAQLQGKKRFVFYPPDRQEPFDDVERVMSTQEPVETIIERGDLLIIPADWCHAAQSLEASMTLTYNFVNQTNFGRFLQATYAYPEKWQIKAKDPELRQSMGLGPIGGNPFATAQTGQASARL